MFTAKIQIQKSFVWMAKIEQCVSLVENIFFGLLIKKSKVWQACWVWIWLLREDWRRIIVHRRGLVNNKLFEKVIFYTSTGHLHHIVLLRGPKGHRESKEREEWLEKAFLEQRWVSVHVFYVSYGSWGSQYSRQLKALNPLTPFSWIHFHFTSLLTDLHNGPVSAPGSMYSYRDDNTTRKLHKFPHSGVSTAIITSRSDTAYWSSSGNARTCQCWAGDADVLEENNQDTMRHDRVSDS